MSKTDLITSALVAVRKQPSCDKLDIGLLTIKTANQTLEEASLMPVPDSLWLSLWYEGEVCCLFADSNLGKSILAVQIAEDIARKGKAVLYFDFELSAKQFQLRYTHEDGKLFEFPSNLYRVEINNERLDVTGNYEDALLSDIEQASLTLGVKVVVVDNLTFLCLEAEKGDAAGQLMKKLIGLKKKYGLSILVLAHTPKRNLSNPITQNDLAGSKKLFNFFDSVFSIGKSAKDDNLRYIKQIKCRFGEFTYGAENVIVCTIAKESSFLRFTNLGTASESEHLRERTNEEKEAIREKIFKLYSNGKKIRQIAEELGMSRSTVGRIVKEG